MQGAHKTQDYNALFIFMKIFDRRIALTEWTKQAKDAGKSIGFVPTMGALHAGHLALARQAKKENDIVVCSIFVNPKQFNNPEDLEKYPRTLEADLEKLRSVQCDAVFCPDEKEMYPGPDTRVYNFDSLDKVMEGQYRRGHFNGVAIVVRKLFDIVTPHRAYFGQKDYQQLQIIKALVKIESMDVEVVPCATVRESDGLAMSSRNVRLTPSQRKEAGTIFRTLKTAREMHPQHAVGAIEKWAITKINASPELEVEYFQIVDAETLLPVENAQPNTRLVACTAVFAGQVRLIDNLLFYS
jgi:pantoate--beta-alanine ligase